MAYRIYTACNDGKLLIDITDSYRLTELYRETCSNIIIEDSANDAEELPEDQSLFARFLPSWGKGRQCLDDVLACGGIGTF